MSTLSGPIVALPPIPTFQSLDPTALKVYLFLAVMADPTAHIALPATNIARALGISPRRAQYALTSLKSHGLLQHAGFGQHAHLRITRYALPCATPHAQPCVVPPPHAPSCVAPHATACVDPSLTPSKTPVEAPSTANTNQPAPEPDPLHAIAWGLKALAKKDPNELLGAAQAIETFFQSIAAEALAKRATTTA